MLPLTAVPFDASDPACSTFCSGWQAAITATAARMRRPVRRCVLGIGLVVMIQAGVRIGLIRRASLPGKGRLFNLERRALVGYSSRAQPRFSAPDAWAVVFTRRRG